MPPNPYKILGVSRNATPQEIEAAFRRRAKQTHPDAGGRAEQFNDVKRAHLVLRDPELRSRFDRTGEFVGPKPNNKHVAALQEIARILGAAVQSDADLGKEPLVEGIKQQLTAELEQIDGETVKLRKAKANCLKLRRRFKRRGNGVNHIEQLLGGIADQVDQQIAKAEGALKCRREALKLLEDYDFERDPQQWVVSFSTGSFHGSGASS